ncbi:hypothetical protein [Arthrobacter monumenti]
MRTLTSSLPGPTSAVDNAPTAKPASELIFSAPAVIQREPVVDVDGVDDTSEPPGKEVITVGKKIRDSVSNWKRIRSQDPSRGLPNAQDVSARHISPQHIMYIK